MRKRNDITRKVILTAARHLFLGQGYVETTIDEIAVRASVTKRTVYGYFPDKRALFKGVIEEAVGEPWEFTSLLREVRTINGLRNALLEIATSLNDVITRPQYIQLLRVAIAEIPTQPDLGVLLESGVTQRSCHAASAVLRTASTQDLVSFKDVDAAARRFVGGFLVPVFLGGLLEDKNRVPGQSHEQLFDYVDDFLSGGLPGTTSGVTGSKVKDGVA